MPPEADARAILRLALRHERSLADGPGAARALCGVQFPVRECLKALVVFADGVLAGLQGQVGPA